MIIQEDAGDACDNGGTRITSFLDVNGNGSLDEQIDSNIQSTVICAPACNCDCDKDEDLTGEFRTQTQGGWKSPPNGNNNGVYLNNNFATAFPSGLTIGHQSGFTLQLTSPTAIRTFLQANGGTSGALTASHVDPVAATNSGTLGNQLVALSLNVGFDLAIANFGASATNLKDLVYEGGSCDGKTVQEILDLGNLIVAGVDNSLTFSQINDCASAINENFVDGNSDGGKLSLP